MPSKHHALEHWEEAGRYFHLTSKGFGGAGSLLKRKGIKITSSRRTRREKRILARESIAAFPEFVITYGGVQKSKNEKQRLTEGEKKGIKV